MISKIINDSIRSDEGIYELISQAQKGCLVSRNEVLKRKGILVISVLKKYNIPPSHQSYDDYLQSSFVALMAAIQDYDEKRGAFATCAVTYIKQELKNTFNKETKHNKSQLSSQKEGTEMLDIDNLISTKSLEEQITTSITLSKSIIAYSKLEEIYADPDFTQLEKDVYKIIESKYILNETKSIAKEIISTQNVSTQKAYTIHKQVITQLKSYLQYNGIHL